MTQHAIDQYKAGDLTFDDLDRRYAIRIGDDIITGDLKSYSAFRADQDGIPVEDDSLPDLKADESDVEAWTDVIEVNLFVGYKELISLRVSPDTMLELIGNDSYSVRH